MRDCRCRASAAGPGPALGARMEVERVVVGSEIEVHEEAAERFLVLS